MGLGATMKFEEMFEALESGLHKCRICGTTFENYNECKKHFHISEVGIDDD
jgi:rubrerythrin